MVEAWDNLDRPSIQDGNTIVVTAAGAARDATGHDPGNRKFG